jgi:acyl dehydratase
MPEDPEIAAEAADPSTADAHPGPTTGHIEADRIEPSRPLLAEQLAIGQPIELGSYTVSREEILEFARQWDPQPFHVDEEVAHDSWFGELIASGLHTLAVFQRLAVLGAYRHWDVVAGRRLHDVQLTGPVTAGTTLHAVVTVESVQYTRPGRALVTQRGVVRNGDAQVLVVLVDAYVRSMHS